ncbi:hypothetical protein H0G86_010598 [Trichoderma simmonsii]|uniref:Uncharacterized protein n=1 Tax=Trichoderma simmonsii TaxID=1491479 RepID=A0A8G0PK76_9HYPO|nr:hypothetical protein H0G86_010598 [Trichoderma simmonsii]
MSWTMGGERGRLSASEMDGRGLHNASINSRWPLAAVIVCVMTSGRTIANILINLLLLGISRSGNTKPGVSQINTTCERAALQLCPSIHHHWLVKCPMEAPNIGTAHHNQK